MDSRKKYYTPLTMKTIVVMSEGAFLAASSESVHTHEVELNAHTDDYESKNFSWDNVSFD